jgi:hypothetical protein
MQNETQICNWGQKVSKMVFLPSQRSGAGLISLLTLLNKTQRLQIKTQAKKVQTKD